MSGTATTAAPSGGVTRMSRRVMNLAHLLTQNARRHGDRVGLIWGDRSWTWREIDRLVSALAAALAARGIAKGDRILVHSKNCEGKGLVKKGDNIVKCQRCKGTGVR